MPKLTCLILLVVLAFSPLLHAEETANDDAWRKTDLRLAAHRGGRDLWPENTLHAYQYAIKQWPHILLEGDLHISSDGEVVLIHDSTLDRTTNGTGPVAEKSLEELKVLDAGYHFSPDNGLTYPHRGSGVQIPTLAEVLKALPEHRFMFEIKAGENAPARVVEAIRNAGATHRVMLASFNPMYMHEVRTLAPEIATCFDYANALKMITVLRQGDWEQYQPTDLMLAAEPSLLKRLAVTPSEIKAIQEKGVLVQIFTLNSEAEIREFLAMGVDSILTDKPDLLDRIIKEFP